MSIFKEFDAILARKTFRPNADTSELLRLLNYYEKRLYNMPLYNRIDSIADSFTHAEKIADIRKLLSYENGNQCKYCKGKYSPEFFSLADNVCLFCLAERNCFTCPECGKVVLEAARPYEITGCRDGIFDGVLYSSWKKYLPAWEQHFPELAREEVFEKNDLIVTGTTINLSKILETFKNNNECKRILDTMTSSDLDIEFLRYINEHDICIDCAIDMCDLEFVPSESNNFVHSFRLGNPQLLLEIISTKYICNEENMMPKARELIAKIIREKIGNYEKEYQLISEGFRQYVNPI